MRPAISTANSVIEIPLEKINEPAFYEILFPVNSPTEQEFLPNVTVKVRPLDELGKAYEIVTGVAQCRFARARGERTIYASVKGMTDEEARRYATDEVLRAAALATRHEGATDFRHYEVCTCRSRMDRCLGGRLVRSAK